ncbi:glycoside hydrolase family 43 protein [Dissoconium aciculare CBS 342.82]|uniref:Glycoside hydrolase family 43 protein n=1 Tax=Dissoconium aciculare CBS 342.82 TaxID=1314786 RepID=A0A6J3MD94_9PEZI|nr:glycoside hydrolase family 43 protein [Dissoconium aciculare CBS 342.82]KAF1824812.1 glycoside hydrolase family 43 protein [Dissoconium aciculare CBS 342.82]
MYPQITTNFPDPSILYADGVWYAYGTNIGAGVINEGPSGTPSKDHVRPAVANIQGATSVDFHTWTLVPVSEQPLAHNGRWAARPSFEFKTWAPSVMRRDDDRYVMYYSSTVNSSTPDPHPGHPIPHCIGAALSHMSRPMGNYIPADEVLVCPMSEGGAIDAQPFRDHDGTFYLLYKIDGNNIGSGGECGNSVPALQNTPIMLQRLKSDAMTLDGPPVQVLDREAEDGPLVEAPINPISKTDLAPEPGQTDSAGPYILFYSSGCTQTSSYTIRYAVAPNLTGPYIRAPQPLLQTGISQGHHFESPGSVGVARDERTGQWRMAFHARSQPRNREWGRVRAMYTAEVEFVRRGDAAGGVEVKILEIGGRGGNY